jgi:hypothetical protein
MELYYSTMVTTHAGHAKKRAAELVASARQYQHPPSYDHDVDNIGLSFKELKQHQIKQALQQCQDRNGPLAKAMIDMIENPPPPFKSSDDDNKTIDAVEEEKEKDKNQSSKLAIKKDSKK